MPDCLLAQLSLSFPMLIWLLYCSLKPTPNGRFIWVFRLEDCSLFIIYFPHFTIYELVFTPILINPKTVCEHTDYKVDMIGRKYMSQLARQTTHWISIKVANLPNEIYSWLPIARKHAFTLRCTLISDGPYVGFSWIFPPLCGILGRNFGAFCTTESYVSYVKLIKNPRFSHHKTRWR